ncbi:hypothetical protein [Candidatus Finniella inopinata]|uniref:Uncharacterized protein n=1 Tax=Candidatus Finniella inopinata TaxID=1696036 RepID=A0A4Q7DG34_9PROT|nr:hypothetical protein [Candidatus Finniella inopinata]RZI45743.1 hypothetical protein EQU50_06480 [Candidatus Finniella inopinata]
MKKEIYVSAILLSSIASTIAASSSSGSGSYHQSLRNSDCSDEDLALFSGCAHGAALAYPINHEEDSFSRHRPSILEGFELHNFRSSKDGSIHVLAIYDETTNTGKIIFRGTDTSNPKDLEADYGIGIVLANTLTGDQRIPDYFGNVVVNATSAFLGSRPSSVVSSGATYSGWFSRFASSGTLNVRTLGIPVVSNVLDLTVSASTLKKSGASLIYDVSRGMKYGAGIGVAVGGPVACTGFGAIAGGSFALGATAVGFAGGLIKGSYNMITQGGYAACDKGYERRLHLEAMKENDPGTLALYLEHGADFTSEAIKIFRRESHDGNPKIIFVGHSLGRFSAGAAYLNYLGRQDRVQDSGPGEEGNQLVSNIGYNGPAGWQGLGGLPTLPQEIKNNIARATSHSQVFTRMIHIRRENDVVASLGQELPQGTVYSVPDVRITMETGAAEAVLANHGIKQMVADLQAPRRDEEEKKEKELSKDEIADSL